MAPLAGMVTGCGGRRAAAWACFLLVLCCASCRRPDSVETWVMADGSGRYEFVADMCDSLGVYDLSFYTRIDGRDAPAAFPMDIKLYSPGGELYGERVYFDYSAGEVSLYRRGCDPSDRGQWRMMVRCDVPGMRGLGLICRHRGR